MTYRVIMTDLDGTLLNKDHGISEANRKAIENLQSQGVRIVFASGRMFTAIRRMTTRYSDQGIIVSCNGGYIMDVHTGKVISETRFSFETSLAVIAVLEKHHLSHHFYTGDTVYTRHSDDSVLYKKMSGALNVLGVNLIAHSPLGRFIHEGIKPHKFGVVVDLTVDIEALKKDLGQIEGIDFFKSADVLLDIMPVGVNKGAALKQVASYLGISPQTFIACGDQENDLEMLELAGLGIAPYGSVDAILKSSDIQLTMDECDIIAYIQQNIF